MKHKIIITIILFIFSFIYIKKASFLIRENDNLMKTIKNKQDIYNTLPVNAIITNQTMIPGISGKKINLLKSYQNMKGINEFKESLLVYDKIPPSKSINNIYNKVIISGRFDQKKISVILEKDSNYCFTETLDIKNDCIKNNKYTIHVTKITNNHLSKVKELVKNGIIFYLEYTNQNNDLDLIKKYLKNNNYEIVTINDLIKE